MIHQISVPSAGESVTEAYIGNWKVKSGSVVKKGDVLVELETQKATFEIESEFTGKLNILYPEIGAKVAIGTIIATVDDADVSGQAPQVSAAKEENSSPVKSKEVTLSSAPDVSSLSGSPSLRRTQLVSGSSAKAENKPVANLGTLPSETAAPAYSYIVDTARGDRLEKATRLRREIAKNLVRAQQTAAILTTFNEVDMTEVLKFREKHKENFKSRHGVGLGVVGFFALACVRALKEFPLVNAIFTGEDLIMRPYIDLSVAVSTDRGLVVPVIKDLDQLDLIGFEKRLSELSERARVGKLSIADMSGGTFTISNGGVFGSLLSTPILNMPQSGILGLHKTEKRPVVVGDQIVVRPMMYLALSYDHRIIDGKEAVQFLVRVKEFIENLSQFIDEKNI